MVFKNTSPFALLLPTQLLSLIRTSRLPPCAGDTAYVMSRFRYSNATNAYIVPKVGVSIGKQGS